MDAPGGRYKIFERDRRLVTVDLLTGREVGASASAILPPSSKQAMELPRDAAVAVASKRAHPVKTDMQDMPASGPWGGISAPSSRPQGRVIPHSERLPMGNFIIRTSPSYDLDGPRDVQLSTFGILWWMITHHFRVIFFLIIGSVLFSWFLLFTPLLLIKGVRHGVLSLFRPSLTRLFGDADQAAAG